ncbi:hypothetical protein HRR88_006617 [Exophiala dermatitidis]|nr:hypothetical protein HRR74_007818 [Exophiala dermatitidis]KAJ4602246.1 hypothetical protein HRR84_002002 [Exophiala dermatitidis]KAJ4619385.1 hypothetical protein HRR88_006617 [Exophiala dermatitidis]KAJ4638874.1 hypothetical protein HRR89_004990 [Exophiala dermatitidis]KAJ4643381.1 hypothetical protein HRR91_007569 [Exophiala dermatitidis]
MGVDNTNTASGRGRNSIRISSKKTYNHGLIILDLAHMPAGACGTWPAFWLLGPNWPYSGEVDIIEGVNGQTNNNMAMHTDSGCSIVNTGAYSGSLETANCDVNAADQATNAGCSISSGSTSSFGSGFNSQGGGVYATEWTSEAVSIWFFPRGSIPSDITSGNPDTSGWGLPQGQFAGSCDIDSKIKNQQLVFDVTFCGDWAGNVWSTDATCSAKASTCQDFVQNNPSAFQDTYWLINSLKVYTENGGGAATTTTTTNTATATSAASSGYETTVTGTPTTFFTLPASSTLQTSDIAVPTTTSPAAVVTTPAATTSVVVVTTAPAALTETTTPPAVAATTTAATTQGSSGGGHWGGWRHGGSSGSWGDWASGHSFGGSSRWRRWFS